MDVNLTPDQKAFARRAIESGRFQFEEEAIHEALALWEERERARGFSLTSLRLADGAWISTTHRS